MSTYITGYTEAKMNGKWYCIDFFQYDEDGNLKHRPCIEGQGMIRHALEWDSLILIRSKSIMTNHFLNDMDNVLIQNIDSVHGSISGKLFWTMYYLNLLKRKRLISEKVYLLLSIKIVTPLKKQLIRGYQI